MLPKSICFVDLETSGTSASFNRIIEIGILKVVNGKLVTKYSKLVNPETYLDPFVEKLTGINSKDLQTAPTFDDIKHEILAILEGSVFVAHNVRFDYGFLKNEFKRVGISFKSKHFCTVKLARQLYPRWQKYNLDSVISHLKIECEKRHRAFDDAKVLWDFYKKAKSQHKKAHFQKAVDLALRKPVIPIHLTEETLESLPENPGVYIFWADDKQIPLYIGKSKNIKDRVLSHFSSDFLSTKEMEIAQQVIDVETIETSGELGALLLESSLVKKMQPTYNRRLRQTHKIIVLKKVETDGIYSVMEQSFDQIELIDIENILGVFKSKKQIKNFLYDIAKEKNLCPKLLNLENVKGACFYNQLGYCHGACIYKESSLQYNLRFDEAFYNLKIRPWKFPKPIIIKEHGEHYVIDKWCLLGSVKSNDESYEHLQKNYNFDLDTYKIIRRYIQNPKNISNISFLN